MGNELKALGLPIMYHVIFEGQKIQEGVKGIWKSIFSSHFLLIFEGEPSEVEFKCEIKCTVYNVKVKKKGQKPENIP